jgi:DNA-binding MarR family transcriptional regulator
VKPRAPKTPWRSALSDERMAHLVKTAFAHTSRALRKRLAACSVSYGHWTFLRILWKTDGLTQRQLAQQAGVTEPSTFAALKAMETRGYITRRKMPHNNKQVRVFVAPAGAALRRAIVSAAENVNRIALDGVPPEDIAATRRTLLMMIENLSERDSAMPAKRRTRARRAP